MPVLDKADLVSRSEVARRLGISEWQVRHLEQLGELPAVRFGARTVKYRLADVEAFIERHTVETGEA